MMRRITVTDQAEIFEIGAMFDKHGFDVDDPQLAVTCVIKLAADRWITEYTAVVPIYTVH